MNIELIVFILTGVAVFSVISIFIIANGVTKLEKQVKENTNNLKK